MWGRELEGLIQWVGIFVCFDKSSRPPISLYQQALGNLGIGFYSCCVWSQVVAGCDGALYVWVDGWFIESLTHLSTHSFTWSHDSLHSLDRITLLTHSSTCLYNTLIRPDHTVVYHAFNPGSWRRMVSQCEKILCIHLVSFNLVMHTSTHPLAHSSLTTHSSLHSLPMCSLHSKRHSFTPSLMSLTVSHSFTPSALITRRNHSLTITVLTHLHDTSQDTIFYTSIHKGWRWVIT